MSSAKGEVRYTTIQKLTMKTSTDFISEYEFAPLEYRGPYASVDDLPDSNETDVLSVVCTVPGDLYINTDTGWDSIVTTGDYNWYYNCDNSHEIKREICKCCGASLPLDRIEDNGSCRCEWCRTWNYVWQELTHVNEGIDECK